MIFQGFGLHLWWRVLVVLLLFAVQSFGLNTDGVLLMSFKYSIVSDPFGVLGGWSAGDEVPCSWKGVDCEVVAANVSGDGRRVTGLALPGFQLVGSIPSSLGMIQHLRNLDLSNNSINGSIPLTLFNASELERLDFSDNRMSGELPEVVGCLKSLRSLNLSGNAFTGVVPENLTSLRNLTGISLKDNYFSGRLPGGFENVEVLDLSSNFINGSLPPNFGGSRLGYFNVSFNRLSGEIPPEFSSKIPLNATLDLSFNNLTGEIPDHALFLNQDGGAFSGNRNLCGMPLKILCPIPSAISTPPNATEPITSPPAIAAIPKTVDSTTGADSPPGRSRSGLKTGTIIGIVAGDMAALGALALIFVYIYRAKKKRRTEETIKKEAESAKDFDWGSSSEEYNWLRSWTCLKKQRRAGAGAGDESSENTNSDSEEAEKGHAPPAGQKTGELVIVDGEKELELETLFKASAYILGASGSSIMYKTVLDDGTALAVRRIGESGLYRFREFENQIRVISKLVHPNLVRIRGFYWGADEKLVIYDFVPNGSLANAFHRKGGTSHRHLPWEVRLKIARGVARGLSYIHEKKHVHGNLKPSNILLDADLEPKVGDFGLERLVVAGESSRKVYGSSRNFGSKRSTASRDSFPDSAVSGGPTPSPSPSALGISPYLAPESLRSLKPNPKWDVFSFGVVLLELLTGKIIVSDEMVPGPPVMGVEEKSKVLRMADVAIRADMEGKEEALLAILKLGYNCISPVPQKRPAMKEVVQALDNIPTSSSSSSYFYSV